MKVLLTLIYATLITAIIFIIVTLAGVLISIISVMMPFIIIFAIVAFMVYGMMEKKKPP